MQEIFWSALAVQSQGRQIIARSFQRHLKSSTQIYCSDEVGLLCQCIGMLSNIIQMADPFAINLLCRITIVVDNIHVQFSWTVKHP